MEDASSTVQDILLLGDTDFDVDGLLSSTVYTTDIHQKESQNGVQPIPSPISIESTSHGKFMNDRGNNESPERGSTIPLNPFADLVPPSSQQAQSSPKHQKSVEEEYHDPFSEGSVSQPRQQAKTHNRNRVGLLSAKKSLDLIMGKVLIDEKDIDMTCYPSYAEHSKGLLQWLSINGFTYGQSSQFCDMPPQSFITMEKTECIQRLGATAGILLFTRLKKIKERFLSSSLDASMLLHKQTPAHTHTQASANDRSRYSHNQSTRHQEHHLASPQQSPPSNLSTHQQAQQHQHQQQPDSTFGLIDHYDDIDNDDDNNDDNNNVYGTGYHSSYNGHYDDNLRQQQQQQQQQYPNNNSNDQQHDTGSSIIQQLFSNFPIPFDWGSQQQQQRNQSYHGMQSLDRYNDDGNDNDGYHDQLDTLSLRSYSSQSSIETVSTYSSLLVTSTASFMSTFYHDFIKLCNDYRLSSQEVEQYKRELAQRLEAKQRAALYQQQYEQQQQQQGGEHSGDIPQSSSLPKHPEYGTMLHTPPPHTSSSSSSSSRINVTIHNANNPMDTHRTGSKINDLCEYSSCQNHCNSTQCSVLSCRIRLCKRHVEKDLFTGYLYCRPCYQNTYSYSMTNNLITDSCTIQ